MFLPRALSSIPDARNALTRLSKVFHAELMDGTPFTIAEEQDLALKVDSAVFEWESPPASESQKGAADDTGEKEQQNAFQVRVDSMTIKRGNLVAIVGPVGSGKVGFSLPTM